MSATFSRLVAARLIELADRLVSPTRILISGVLDVPPDVIYAAVAELAQDSVSVVLDADSEWSGFAVRLSGGILIPYLVTEGTGLPVGGSDPNRGSRGF